MRGVSPWFLALLGLAPLLTAQAGTPHWALVAPHRPELPAVVAATWPRNAIDRFVLARLERDGRAPSAEADRTTLLRRLHLDLTGLPPSPQEQDAFLADTRPDAYERAVDGLLASPHYGEQQARAWLDLARYADSNGFEKDRTRSIWPWRDWVIRAFDADQPQDQFAVEQIAGDLLPGATVEQRLATGFLRNSMLNEEGGIDVEEYRHHAVVDRLNTIATTWLGLTVACAQCHDHKYDPIKQREYYQLLAFLNQCDEPSLEVPDAQIARERERQLAAIAARELELPERLPLPPAAYAWHPLVIHALESSGKATLAVQDDGSVRAVGATPDADEYTLAADTRLTGIRAFRLEALTDPTLPAHGPGRADNGNFVVSELAVTAAGTPVELLTAQADFSQDGWSVSGAIDGDPRTGWAILDRTSPATRDRTAVFETRAPIGSEGGTRLTFRLSQRFGGRHTLGRFRLSVGVPRGDGDLELRRRERLARLFAQWQDTAAQQASPWTALVPQRCEAENGTTLVAQPDGSVLAQGDMPQTEVYVVEADTNQRVTALRLDVLTHDSFTDRGPGRAPIYSPGDFMLSEIEVDARPAVAWGRPPERVAIRTASHSYAHPDRPASKCFDGSLETGWSIQGRAGEDHHAVFVFDRPIEHAVGTHLRVTLRQHGIHQMTIGRFRLSVTDAPNPRASGLPADLEALLLADPAQRTAPELDRLRRLFLAAAPELADARAQIAHLRKKLPRPPTTLVVQERAPEMQRKTWLRGRGEFTRRVAEVEPGTPAVLHPLPDGPRDRLALARWLTSADNPLFARVAVNRLWQSVFGHGLVATPEDFGTRGERPTHPELLDWLASEFRRVGCRQKAMLRLLVTSATYRQAAAVTPELLAADPKNELLARAPRFRVTAEGVRDIVLCASGLLADRIGGPSVFPPQPPGFTTLGYGAAEWQTSTGPDRYRRGLYTFARRTTPYALSQTFDAPSGETACPRRARTDTPLQALALLNDQTFIEGARGLAARVLREAQGDDARLHHAFRCCLARAPRADEAAEVRAFLARQRERLARGELAAGTLAGASADADPARVAELAAWTAVARVLLNLDETVTRS